VHRIRAGLADGGRGQLIAACGTGKTSIALWASERLIGDGGLVLVAVPTVGLVAQTLQAWRAELGDTLDALAVCGDDSVNDGQSCSGSTRRRSVQKVNAEDSLGAVEDILDPVTTDSDVVAEWLRGPFTATTRLIVGTHVSCHVMGAGLQKARTVADILVVDEAHRSAGASGKHTALLHDDDVIPAHRRLYMTATPRVFNATTSRQDDNHARKSDEFAHGMDDKSVFGPVLYNYPFSRAIEEGYLDDYRVAVIGVTKAEVLRTLRATEDRRREDGTQVVADERTAMVQAALSRAAADLGLRRIIAFCTRVADAQRFASTFTATLNVLPPRLRPERALHATHIHGGMNQSERARILGLLAEPPDDGWTVVSNARCLSEGIDIPSVDCITFTAAKRSPIEIVQAVGRALRCSANGSGIATILVPVLLPDDYSGTDEEVDAGDFEILWEVVRALRSHDDMFASALDFARANKYRGDHVLDKITFSLPHTFHTPRYLEHLTARLVRSATSRWWDGYGKLVAYRDTHGDFNVRRDSLADDFDLVRWIARTRQAYRNGTLPQERIDALAEINFPLRAVTDPIWRANIDTLRRFHAEHGHIQVPETLTSDRGTNLKRALIGYRNMKRRGTLSAAREAALNHLGMDWSSHNHALHREMIAFLRQHRAEHGHIAVPRGCTTSDGHDVSIWLQARRNKRRDGLLDDEEIRELNDLGMVWDGGRLHWERRLAFLRRFHAEHGTINVPRPRGASRSKETAAGGGEHVDISSDRELSDEGSGVGDPTEVKHKVWALISQYRSLRHRGKLAQFKIDDLDSLGIEWGTAARDWESVYRSAVRYRQKHGHLDLTEAKGAEVSVEYAELGRWLDTQRDRQFAGSLSPDRVAKLEALDFAWLRMSRTDEVWYRWLSALDDHCRVANIHPNVLPQNTETKHRRKIGNWLSVQRLLWQRGKLAAARVDALAQRGITPAKRRQAAPQKASVHALATDPWRHQLDAIRDAFTPGEQPDWESAAVATANRVLKKLRRQHDAGELPMSRVAELAAILPDWDIAQVRTRRQLIAARRFAAANGHLGPSATYVDDDGVTLGAWLSTQRRYRVAGELDELIASKLESLGIDWEPEASHWAFGLAAARDFQASHGHLRVSQHVHYTTPTGETRLLRQFLQLQRARRREGRLEDSRVADLDRIHMVWEPEMKNWDAKVAALRKYRESHGHIMAPWDAQVDGIHIGRVVSNARRDRAAGRLPKSRIADLDELGLVWDAREAGRREMIEFLRHFHAEHGHIRVSPSVRAMLSLTDEGKRPKSSGVDVCRWLREQRNRRARGDLSPEQIEELDTLGMVWTKRPQDAARWDRMMDLATTYFAEHGHLCVSAAEARGDRNAAALYHWCRRLRLSRQKGQLDHARIAELDAVGMQWPKTDN
jgi:superfamily II DNA or RNA helicase